MPVSRQLERGWEPDQLARALRAAARRIGRTPHARDWDGLAREHGWPSSATVMRRLGSGSWVAAVEAARLDRRAARAWSEAQVLDVLRREADKLGRPPRRAEWATGGQARPTCRQVALLFGSWSAALRAAGLQTYRLQRSPMDDLQPQTARRG